MRSYPFRNTTISLLIATIIAACAPQAATPPVDIVGTRAAELAVVMLTQTAGAVTPTPLPPTATETPSFTETPAGPPTEKPVPKPAAVIVFAGCWTGPGENYTLISNVDPGTRGRQNVVILGVGSEPGWIVIRNPYFNNPCWIRVENLEIDPIMDMSQFPPMTPGAP
ncbi:MAG: hypothetical protein QY332_09080 [Anaerolineales bacterium]|nr:MAG: hypothetical protein QY332_09080 [Anaerolineales bacterium]